MSDVKKIEQQDHLTLPTEALHEATSSTSKSRLAVLAEHANSFVWAAVAINPNVNRKTLQILLADERPGVVEQALRNDKLIPHDFIFTFKTIATNMKYQNVWSTLAGHKFASLTQLAQ